MNSKLDPNDPDYFSKRMLEKETIDINNYKHQVISTNWDGASKRARIIRNSKPPKPL